jgi:carotenoid cleavage dioxygenase
MVLPMPPLGLMFGQQSFGESLRWRPELRTRIGVIDRTSDNARTNSRDDVRWYDVDPHMSFHVINAFDDGDDAVLDVCAYADGHVVQTFAELMRGPIRTPAAPYPERMHLFAKGTAHRSRLSQMPLEFPVPTTPAGAVHRRVFGVAWPNPYDLPTAPAVLDMETGRVQRARFRDGLYAGESIPVPKPGASSADACWLLTVVLDTYAGRSELWILDGENLDAPPVAVARLPYAMPLGFHGSFSTRATLEAAGYPYGT